MPLKTIYNTKDKMQNNFKTEYLWCHHTEVKCLKKDTQYTEKLKKYEKIIYLEQKK